MADIIKSITVIITGRFNHRNSNTDEVIKSILYNPKVEKLIISCDVNEKKLYQKYVTKKVKIIISNDPLNYPTYLPNIYRGINRQAYKFFQTLKFVETDYLIRIRSDIQIKKLDDILDSINKNPFKIGIYSATPNLIDGGGCIFSMCDFIFVGKKDYIYNICKLDLSKEITLQSNLSAIIWSFVSRAGWTPYYICKEGLGFHPEQIIFRSYIKNRYGKIINSSIDDLSFRNIKYYENIIHNDFYSLPKSNFQLSDYLARYDDSNYLSENEMKEFKSQRYI